jgi:hypothetical protein
MAIGAQEELDAVQAVQPEPRRTEVAEREHEGGDRAQERAS